MNLESLYPHCDCFDQYQYREKKPSEPRFHSEVQDTQCDGWKRLVDLVEAAAADEREEFAPGREIPLEEWRGVITLPHTIAKLKSVRRFVLYGSWLVRIPTEIGWMDNLERFEPYTSHRLHWFPYEITRCKNLKDSVVSTRSLYGNYKFRPTFPRLQPPKNSTTGLDLAHLSPGTWGVEAAARCSVCDGALASSGLHQVWLSTRVATDVLPLLVTACSENCVGKLPDGALGYVRTPHGGGAKHGSRCRSSDPSDSGGLLRHRYDPRGTDALKKARSRS